MDIKFEDKKFSKIDFIIKDQRLEQKNKKERYKYTTLSIRKNIITTLNEKLKDNIKILKDALATR